MHQMEFCQAYCKDMLTRIPRKFISQFYELYSIFYVFWKVTQISGIFKSKKKFKEKEKHRHSSRLLFCLRPSCRGTAHGHITDHRHRVLRVAGHDVVWSPRRGHVRDGLVARPVRLTGGFASGEVNG
jgi:hypothetical protein